MLRNCSELHCESVDGVVATMRFGARDAENAVAI